MKRITIPLILLGVSFGFAGGAYFFLIYMQRPKAMEVVIAKEDILAGSPITTEKIGSIPWQGKKFPEGFISAQERDRLINRVTRVDVVGGCPITKSAVAPVGTPLGLFGKIPEGMRAVTVKVDEVSGVAGFIRPGSKVDVVLTGAGAELEGKEGKGAKIILQNVMVLATGQRVTQLEGKEKPQMVNTVTLLVTPEEAERLALAIKMGSLLLTLRSGSDSEPISTRGSIPADVWGLSPVAAVEDISIIELIQGGVKTKIRTEREKEEQAEEAESSPTTTGL